MKLPIKQNPLAFSQLSRRHFLRGTGACLALPLLESLPSARAATTSNVPPRLIFIETGWGVTEETWFPAPTDTGLNYTFNSSMKPLEKYRKDFSIISGLSHTSGTKPHGAAANFLTAADLDAVPGAAYTNSISCDQIAAKHIGKDTRYASIQLTDRQESGGYGRGFGGSLSWSEGGIPMDGLQGPIEFFNALFGDTGESIEQIHARLAQKKSILDSVITNIKSLNPTLSSTDKGKLEEYLNAVREIEKQISREEYWSSQPKPEAPLKEPSREILPGSSQEITTMFKLIAAACQTDSTRVVTYRVPIKGIMQEVGGVSGHTMSHYKGSGRVAREASERHDLIHAKLLGEMIDTFKNTPDVDGKSIYDNSLILWGSGTRSGHLIYDLPILLFGHGGGKIKQGQHIAYTSKSTPLSNLFLTMMQQSGVPAETFAESNATCTEIVV